MRQVTALLTIARFSVTIGVFWHLWGIWGFWWAALLGLFWEIWVCMKWLTPIVLRAAGAP